MVWNMVFFFPTRFGDDDPIWRTPSFFRGVGITTTNFRKPWTFRISMEFTIWVWVKIEYPNSWMVNTKNRLKSVVPQVLHFDSYPYEFTIAMRQCLVFFFAISPVPWLFCQVEAAWQRFGANGKLPPGPVFGVYGYCCFMGSSMDFTDFI